MPEYHIGNVGRGEVPTVADEYLDQLHAEAKAYDARRWAAAWKAVAKKYHEYHVLVHDCNMRCHGVLHSWMKRAKKAEAELAELKAQQNER